MLNFGFSSNDDICSDNCIYSRFKLKDKCRSEKWKLCLYGVKTIQVVRAQMQFFDSVHARCCVDGACGLDVQKTAEVSAAAVHGVTGFVGAVHTGTRPGVSPTIRVGKGWWGRRGLPGVLPPELGARVRVAGQPRVT